MLDKFIAEIIGTFIFLSVIMIAVNSDKSLAWIEIGLALSICILLVGAVSGGHLNPAVSFMFYLNNSINSNDLAMYTTAQLIGAGLAYTYYTTKIKAH